MGWALRQLCCQCLWSRLGEVISGQTEDRYNLASKGTNMESPDFCNYIDLQKRFNRVAFISHELTLAEHNALVILTSEAPHKYH